MKNNYFRIACDMSLMAPYFLFFLVLIPSHLSLSLVLSFFPPFSMFLLFYDFSLRCGGPSKRAKKQTNNNSNFGDDGDGVIDEGRLFGGSSDTASTSYRYVWCERRMGAKEKIRDMRGGG